MSDKILGFFGFGFKGATSKLGNDQDLEFSGRVAVLAVRGKEKVNHLNKYISGNGFKPIVFEFEESLKFKEWFLRNLSSKKFRFRFNRMSQ